MVWVRLGHNGPQPSRWSCRLRLVPQIQNISRTMTQFFDGACEPIKGDLGASRRIVEAIKQLLATCTQLAQFLRRFSMKTGFCCTEEYLQEIIDCFVVNLREWDDALIAVWLCVHENSCLVEQTQN